MLIYDFLFWEIVEERYQVTTIYKDIFRTTLTSLTQQIGLHSGYLWSYPWLNKQSCLTSSNYRIGGSTPNSPYLSSGRQMSLPLLSHWYTLLVLHSTKMLLNSFPSLNIVLLSTWVHPRFFVEASVAYRFSFLCWPIMCLYVLNFWVPWCDVRYVFRMKTIFRSSLSPIVCSSYVRYVATFSGLSIFDCPFGIL